METIFLTSENNSLTSHVQTDIDFASFHMLGKKTTWFREILGPIHAVLCMMEFSIFNCSSRSVSCSYFVKYEYRSKTISFLNTL